MVEATLQTPADAPEEIDIDAFAREVEILALEDFRRLVFSILDGHRPPVDELRQTLFAAKKGISDVQKFVALLKRRKAAAADIETAAELESVFNAYFPEARQLIDNLSARAAYFRVLASRADSAAQAVLRKLSERQGEWIGLRTSASVVLKLRTTRASQQRLRDLSDLIRFREHQLRELDSDAVRFGTAGQIAMRQEIENLQALAAANKHRPDLAESLAAKEAEFVRLSAIPARRAELEAEISRIREMFREVQSAQNSWRDVEFDLPADAIGSQLPPALAVAPHDEYVHFGGHNQPAFSDEFHPVTGRLS